MGILCRNNLRFTVQKVEPNQDSVRVLLANFVEDICTLYT